MPGIPTSPPKAEARPAGTNPWLLAGGALAVGVALARLIDWRARVLARE